MDERTHSMANAHVDLPKPLREVPVRGSHRVRVRYCECDPMGVAHHAAYVPWLEIGRTELLREAGVRYADLEVAGVFLVIVKLEVSYKRPAYYDDLVEVRTRVAGPASRVKIRHEYEVVRVGEGDPTLSNQAHEQSVGNTLAQRRVAGEVLVTGTSLLACVDRSGRPTALPDWLVRADDGPA